ncbi:MAG: hypothetical protein KGI98_15975 [Euryarchaeota archaeon]|nr:hypothetical protein [Euryarchaeota archaeon]
MRYPGLAALPSLSGELSKYPHLFPPPGFNPVDRNGSLSPYANLTTAPVTLETISLGPGQEGWIRTIGLLCSDFTKVFLQVKVGNVVLRDYAHIVVPLGQPETPKETFIRIPVNVPLTLVAVGDGSGAGVTIRWNLFGWYYDVNQGS